MYESRLQRKRFMKPIPIQLSRNSVHIWLLDSVGLSNRLFTKMKLTFIEIGYITPFFLYDTETKIYITSTPLKRKM